MLIADGNLKINKLIKEYNSTRTNSDKELKKLIHPTF